MALICHEELKSCIQPGSTPHLSRYCSEVNSANWTIQIFNVQAISIVDYNESTCGCTYLNAMCVCLCPTLL